MRQIKFRVWHKQQKRILSNDWLISSEAIYKYMVENDGIELMQFTGLHDKNGKEIYGGDIVTFYKGYVDDSWTDSEQGKPYVITWHSEDGYLGFYAKRGNKHLVPGAGQRGNYKWSWEVIGNIYENPELLAP